MPVYSVVSVEELHLTSRASYITVMLLFYELNNNRTGANNEGKKARGVIRSLYDVLRNKTRVTSSY